MNLWRVFKLRIYNIVDIVKKIQKENPQSGSFVHWSNTGDLVKFADARPSEVAELLNHLFDANALIMEKIEKFREVVRSLILRFL